MIFAPKKVALLHGGPSSEHNVSLRSADSVRRSLEDTDHQVKDVYVDKGGRWHTDGIERSVDRALQGVDSVFIAMHGEYGEDGEVQRILEENKVPFNGAGSLSSRKAFNKAVSRDIFEKSGLRIPRGFSVSDNDELEYYFPHGSYHLLG